MHVHVAQLHCSRRLFWFSRCIDGVVPWSSTKASAQQQLHKGHPQQSTATIGTESSGFGVHGTCSQCWGLPVHSIPHACAQAHQWWLHECVIPVSGQNSKTINQKRTGWAGMHGVAGYAVCRVKWRIRCMLRFLFPNLRGQVPADGLTIDMRWVHFPCHTYCLPLRRRLFLFMYHFFCQCTTCGSAVERGFDASPLELPLAGCFHSCAAMLRPLLYRTVEEN